MERGVDHLRVGLEQQLQDRVPGIPWNLQLETSREVLGIRRGWKASCELLEIRLGSNFGANICHGWLAHENALSGWLQDCAVGGPF